jgi:solute carrier family 45 protein 1/2/4
MALVGFSIVTFIMSVLLPWVVQSPEGEGAPAFTVRAPAGISSLASKAEKYRPSLLTAWMLSHGVFAASMILAPFVQSLRSATLIIGVCGMQVYQTPTGKSAVLTIPRSWAISCWAPFAFLGVEINRLSQSNSHAYGHLGRNSIELEAPSTLHLNQGQEEGGNSTGEGAGKYLGIMNLYTTLPQFVGTGISYVVFSVLEPGKSPELSDAPPEEHHSTDGPNAIAVCLFIGACSAVVAAVATRRLRRLQSY